MTHEPGFYWVSWYKEWQVAEYDGDFWYICADDDPYDANFFSQILGPILPPDHTP